MNLKQLMEKQRERVRQRCVNNDTCRSGYGMEADMEVLVKFLTTSQNELLDAVVAIVEGKKWKGEPSADASDITWACHIEHNKVIADITSLITEARNNK